MNPDDITVTNNTAQNRFEVIFGEQVAMVEYILTSRNITFTHTEVPRELEGQGIASQMARTALEYARDHDLKVIPLCPFVGSYIRRHREYQPLVIGRRRNDQ